MSYSFSFKEKYQKIIDGHIQPVNEAEFVEFEAKYQLLLPEEIKELYRHFNGATFVNYQTFDYHGKDNQTGENIFKKVHLESISRFKDLIPREYRGFWPEIPLDDYSYYPLNWDPEVGNKFLTFGDAGYGPGDLMVGIVPENFGWIYWWDFESNEYNNPYLLTHSLDELLDRLYLI